MVPIIIYFFITKENIQMKTQIIQNRFSSLDLLDMLALCSNLENVYCTSKNGTGVF